MKIIRDPINERKFINVELDKTDPTFVTKEDTFNMWHTPITNDLRSWGYPRLNTTLPDPNVIRNYISCEQQGCDNIWNVFPIGHDKVKTMIAMRNPLSRSLAGDGGLNRTDIAVNGYYNTFAKSNNFALRFILGIPRVDKHILGYRDVNEIDYHKAVQRLKSFDHIIITESMDETTHFLCKEWGWSTCK
jgi:hypothetical protein